jgi:hypothetical protein
VTKSLQEKWATLQDTPIVVIFSLQQKAGFQPPAFIPIRGGHVLQTHREGESYFVDFRLKDYVGLHAPSREGDGQSAQVARFTSRLREITDTPYSASASLGSQLSARDVDVASEQSVLFARIGSYLAKTDTFEKSHFVRVLGIRHANPAPAPEVEYLQNFPAQPSYRLQARSAYDLVLFHAQPSAPPAPAPFELFVDGSNLRILGSGRFTVASRYDEVTVRLATADATGLEDHESAIVLEPDKGVEGPAITLKVLVEADRRRAIGVASSQAVALLMVALAGVLSAAPLAFRISLAVVGALAAVALGLIGAAALRPPTLPSANPHPQATAH